MSLKALADAVLQRDTQRDTQRDKVSRGDETNRAAPRHLSGVPSTYAELARSGLIARVQAAWPWIAEHRPDLFRRICDADYAGDVERLRDAMETASRAWADRGRGDSTRIYSKVLDAELWIAPDEEAAAELQREGVTLPVLLPAEAMILGKMAESDAREIFKKLALVQKVFPGSRLRSVGPHSGGALDA